MIKVSPSILAADMLHMGRDVKRMVDAGCDLIHVDIMDGHFVPNLSYGPGLVKALKGAFDVPLDVHLMIDNPEQYMETFIGNGASILTIHAEIPGDVATALTRIRALGAKAGLSVKPGTPVEAIRPLLPLCDLVLVMTVEPGFGGQAFMESQLDTIRQVRALIERYNPACELEVDGGISPKTAPLVVEAGANVLVAGSAVYGAEDIPAAIQALRVSGGAR